ncbi:MAG: F0F1 ATP synthase subunit A [Beijerinckiaceae bacterium]
MAAEAGSAIDPIEQFGIVRYVPLHLFGRDISFTNSAAYMFASVALISLLMILGARRQAHVPGRAQGLAEMAYDFVANMLESTTGKEGMKFFPFVFSLFMFILVANVVSLVPYTFSVTAQIVITVVMSLMVFLIVIVVGIAKHGLHFFKLFVPPGVPIYILPLVIAIEIISFLSRPVSHSVRLFANMLAGHITLQVFGAFVVLLLGAGGWAAIAPLPFAMTLAMLALELLVAFLQAYVFAMLTCMYLNDALHPGH